MNFCVTCWQIVRYNLGHRPTGRHVKMTLWGVENTANSHLQYCGRRLITVHCIKAVQQSAVSNMLNTMNSREARTRNHLVFTLTKTAVEWVDSRRTIIYSNARMQSSFCATEYITRNSPGDEIPERLFFSYDIVNCTYERQHWNNSPRLSQYKKQAVISLRALRRPANWSLWCNSSLTSAADDAPLCSL